MSYCDWFHIAMYKQIENLSHKFHKHQEHVWNAEKRINLSDALLCISAAWQKVWLATTLKCFEEARVLNNVNQAKYFDEKNEIFLYYIVLI